MSAFRHPERSEGSRAFRCNRHIACNVYMQKPGYVYILTNKTKTVLYIGVTSDLAKRIHQHMNGLGSSFAAKYNLKFLVYLEVFDSITTAIEREKLLKGKTRKKKQAIISSLNPRWQDLSDSVL